MPAAGSTTCVAATAAFRAAYSSAFARKTARIRAPGARRPGAAALPLRKAPGGGPGPSWVRLIVPGYRAAEAAIGHDQHPHARGERAQPMVDLVVDEQPVMKAPGLVTLVGLVAATVWQRCAVARIGEQQQIVRRELRGGDPSPRAGSGGSRPPRGTTAT